MRALEWLWLENNKLVTIEPGALAAQEFRALFLSGNDFSHLDLTGTTLVMGSELVPHRTSWFTVDEDEITRIVLDDAYLNELAFSEVTSKRYVLLENLSAVGLGFVEQRDSLGPLIEMGPITNLVVDQGLAGLFAEQFEAFATKDGNTLTVVPYGDTNQDLTVDFADFLTLASNFGKPGRWSQGDFNRDQLVGLDDFLLLSNGFGAKPGTTNVPEPRSVITALLLCLWMTHDCGVAVGSTVVRTEPVGSKKSAAPLFAGIHAASR